MSKFNPGDKVRRIVADEIYKTLESNGVYTVAEHDTDRFVSVGGMVTLKESGSNYYDANKFQLVVPMSNPVITEGSRVKAYGDVATVIGYHVQYDTGFKGNVLASDVTLYDEKAEIEAQIAALQEKLEAL